MKYLLFIFLLIQEMAWGSVNCPLSNTFVFGASISSGYSGPTDLYGTSKDMALDNPELGSYKSPGQILAEKYQANHINNIARINGRGNSGYQTNHSLRTDLNPYMSLNINTIQRYRNLCNPFYTRANTKLSQNCADYRFQQKVNEVSKMMSSATAWIGIDGFYWDAIPQAGMDMKNPNDQMAMKVKCGKASRNAIDLIRTAKQQGKTLILGNVPYDDNPKNVSWLVRQFWRPTYKPCVDLINRSLDLFCKQKDGCFILDFKTIAAELLNNGINFKSRHYRAKEMRFDGLHLSEVGNLYVAERLEQLLPPEALKQCTDNSAAGSKSIGR